MCVLALCTLGERDDVVSAFIRGFGIFGTEGEYRIVVNIGGRVYMGCLEDKLTQKNKQIVPEIGWEYTGSDSHCHNGMSYETAFVPFAFAYAHLEFMRKQTPSTPTHTHSHTRNYTFPNTYRSQKKHGKVIEEGGNRQANLPLS